MNFIERSKRAAMNQKPQEVHVATKTFDMFDIHPAIKKNIALKGYKLATPIQEKAIPEILQGKDIVGIANTGTGKTAAFLLPLIQKVINNPRAKILIMGPTRELAVQVQQELMGFTQFLGIYSVSCIGGQSIRKQVFDLRRRHNFVIGTPGRLKDLVQQRVLDLSQFETVVLDEADRMVDMGFINDMRFLLGLMPEKKHSLFFSATFSPEIRSLIQTFLQDPVTISVKSGETSANVEQNVVRVSGRDEKFRQLEAMLTKPEFNKVLIFGRTKHGVENLTVALLKKGFRVESIHGDKTQYKRQKALELFKKNHIQALIATDVAARGLDIANVSHVINFDVPETYDDYVHRIGRTGRADKKGIALTFVD
jgi:superfamily II DNA/RNA helicase